MRTHPYRAAEQLHFQVVVQFEIPAPLLEQEGWREAPGW